MKAYYPIWNYGNYKVASSSVFTSMKKAARYAERWYRIYEPLQSYRIETIEINPHDAW